MRCAPGPVPPVGVTETGAWCGLAAFVTVALVVVLTGNEMVGRDERDLKVACVLIKPTELRSSPS